MPKPLFICHGNVMRSQMAEGYYNHLTQTKDATSAGCDPLTPHSFTAPYKHGIQVMREDGIDISSQTVKLITPELADSADAIYVMTFKDDLPDYILNSPKTVYWDIDDPYDMPIEQVREIQQQVKTHVLNIL